MTVRRIAALLALGLLVAACSAGPGTGGLLEGTDWVLRSYVAEGDLVTVPETQFADAEFRSNRVSGFSGCNDFDALYRAGGRTLFISEPSSTLVACDDEANASRGGLCRKPAGQPLLQRATGHPHDLRCSGHDRPRVRCGAPKPDARQMDRRHIRDRSSLADRTDRGLVVDGRVQDRQRWWLEWLQPVHRHLRDQRQRPADRPTCHHPHGVRGRDHEPGGRLPHSDGGRGADRPARAIPPTSPTSGGPRSFRWCDHRRNRTHRRRHRHRCRPRRRRRPRLRPRPRRRVVLQVRPPRHRFHRLPRSRRPRPAISSARMAKRLRRSSTRPPGLRWTNRPTSRAATSIRRRSSCPPTRPPSRRP